MSKILKAEPLPQAVICDTNILWFEDKAPVANPAFDQFWDAMSKEFDFELYIPEVVREELLFQHYTSCYKLFKATENNLKKISLITAIQHSTRLNADKMKRQVVAKFGKWLRAKRGTILEFPVEKIDWKRLSYDAVWRVPPFVPDAKNPDSEKGFRDALILETVYHFATDEGRQVNIAFLCNDQVLRTAALARLKGDQRFTAYESLKEFETYLRLTKEKFTNEFISKIISKARDRFFAQGDTSCLVARDNLTAKLQADYKDFFEDVTKSEQAKVQSVGGGVSSTTWSPVGSGGFWITSPEFLRTESGQHYLWKSTMRFMRLYNRQLSGFESLTGDISGSPATEKVLSLPFKVTWSAMVKNDARFHDLKVENISLEGNEFRVPAEEEIKVFRLRPMPATSTATGNQPSGGGT
ncbi:MAG: PIN domain-containing protein [Elusimicrobiota bacterium]|jgi:hypothetical protein